MCATAHRSGTLESVLTKGGGLVLFRHAGTAQRTLSQGSGGEKSKK